MLRRFRRLHERTDNHMIDGWTEDVRHQERMEDASAEAFKRISSYGCSRQKIKEAFRNTEFDENVMADILCSFFADVDRYKERCLEDAEQDFYSPSDYEDYDDSEVWMEEGCTLADYTSEPRCSNREYDANLANYLCGAERFLTDEELEDYLNTLRANRPKQWSLLDWFDYEDHPNEKSTLELYLDDGGFSDDRYVDSGYPG